MKGKYGKKGRVKKNKNKKCDFLDSREGEEQRSHSEILRTPPDNVNRAVSEIEVKSRGWKYKYNNITIHYGAIITTLTGWLEAPGTGGITDTGTFQEPLWETRKLPHLIQYITVIGGSGS